MSNPAPESGGAADGGLSAQVDKLLIERDKVAASLHRLDPSGELRPIWNMLKNPSTSGHGYWDLIGMERRVYEQHPPQTPGVVTAGAAARESRRDHGLLLENRLAELNRELVVLERKLRPVEPAPVVNKFFPAARPRPASPSDHRVGGEGASHALSIGHAPVLGWRGASRYKACEAGRAQRC
ncbi:hypothetical protein JCM9279_001779 [Rhodotorula babjevae]